MTESAAPELACRDRFPIVESTTYLISNSLGAMPKEAEAELVKYAQAWSERGVRAWEESWWTLAAELGDLLAPVIGAGPGEIMFEPCVTLAHAIVLSAIDWTSPRNKIVTDEMHFPSILYLLKEQRRLGAEIVVVPSDDGIGVDAGRIIEAIDEATAVVALSHVYFKTAYIQDVGAIARRAREAGAVSIIDGYQAVGTIPVDVAKLGCDVYIGGTLKWLCGGPGNAFVWCRPGARERIAPVITGWPGHARPFAFEPELERRGDAWRFLAGTPGIPGLYAARPGIATIRAIGVETIRRQSVRQTARLIEKAGELGFACKASPDPRRRGGTVAIDLPHGLEISRALKAREILCDYRPGAGIRLSPHFYNLDDEIDLAVAAIGEIVREELWSEFGEKRTSVT